MPDPMPLPGISLLNFYKRREVVDVLRLRIFFTLIQFLELKFYTQMLVYQDKFV